MFESLRHRVFSLLGRLGTYLGLGLGIVLLVFVTHAQAAEIVQLQYRDLRLAIPLSELQAFGTTREMSPALQQFLEDANQEPEQVQEWLTTSIEAPRLSSSISSDFVLLQINKTLGAPLGREDLDALRTTFTTSLEDNQSFSLLELLGNYPDSSVRLDLSRLGQAYNDVNLVVTRIEPVLQIVDTLLPELVCDCGLTTADQSDPDQRSLAHRQSQGAIASLLPTADASSFLKEGSASINDPSLIALESSDSPAIANKSLVIRFGPLGRSISMQDLTYFAETGVLPRGWGSLFRIAGVDPTTVQTALNQTVSVNLRFLDRTLNSLLGEYLLYQVGQVVHTPSDTANIQALRSASILSVADDGQLSLLELLQRYPTQDVYLDGARLARLGRTANQFQASGGIRGTVISLEDWLVELQASKAESLCACEDGTTGENALGAPPVAPTISAERIAEFLPPNWQPVPPHREDHGIIKVVWLQGTPYEMGYQHGEALHAEIASLGTDVLGALRFAGRGLALSRLAERRSYPTIVEECRGLTAATEDIGMTMDACLVLAYGDVYQEFFGNSLPNMLFWDGCSQWVATGEATIDGRLYHGSTLDNDQQPIDYILNNPVIFVRQPNDGLPHVFITYPSVIWPNWGLNVAGITLGLDSLHPRGSDDLFLQGSSDVQIMGQVLKTATTFAEGRQIMESQPSARANLIMMADGKSKEAGVFEIIGESLAVREIQDNGVLYVTNHAVDEAVFDKQRQPLNDSTVLRFERFSQLMEPDGISTFYGMIDPAVMARIGRDRVHPRTLEASPFEVFDDDASPGGNGSLRQGIYDPDRLLLWVAAGPPPVPENPFVCFSLGEMLGFPNAIPCESPSL